MKPTSRKSRAVPPKVPQVWVRPRYAEVVRRESARAAEAPLPQDDSLEVRSVCPAAKACRALLDLDGQRTRPYMNQSDCVGPGWRCWAGCIGPSSGVLRSSRRTPLPQDDNSRSSSSSVTFRRKSVELSLTWTGSFDFAQGRLRPVPTRANPIALVRAAGNGPQMHRSFVWESCAHRAGLRCLRMTIRG